jgi:sugar phosphate isomerase/epimerase
MRLAVSNIAWDRAEDEPVRDLLASLGADGVEIAPTKVWADPLRATDADVNECRSFWEQAGLSVPACQALLFGQPSLTLFDDEVTRGRTHVYLAGIMRVGAALGARAFVFGSPQNRRLAGRSPAEAFAIAVDFFRACGASAAALGVALCLEPNPAEYGCDFVRTIDEGAALVARVAHPGFRLHVDTSALMLNGEDIDAAIDRASPFMGHVHVSEPHLGRVGASDAAHRQVAAALRRSGWTGWVSVEMRSGQPGGNLAAVRDAVLYAREAYLA